MRIIETDDFEKDLHRLPPEIQKLYRKQKNLFGENWLDARLHIKRNKELEGVYSFRITRRYRAFFYLRGEQAVFFKIGHRKDVYA